MKGLLLFAICMTGLVYLACRTVVSTPSYRGHNEAVYARDTTHHCAKHDYTPPSEEWDYFDHRVETKPGYWFYNCDSGVDLIIYDNEEQP